MHYAHDQFTLEEKKNVQYRTRVWEKKNSNNTLNIIFRYSFKSFRRRETRMRLLIIIIGGGSSSSRVIVHIIIVVVVLYTYYYYTTQSGNWAKDLHANRLGTYVKTVNETSSVIT